MPDKVLGTDPALRVGLAKYKLSTKTAKKVKSIAKKKAKKASAQ